MEERKFKPVFGHIITRTLSYGWFEMLQEVLLNGGSYAIDSGSLDFEGNWRRTKSLVIEMHTPGVRPLAPYIPEGRGIPIPTTEEGINAYMEYLVTSERAKNEHYTYGEDLAWEIEELIRYYKRFGFGNACCYMAVGRPETFYHYNWEVDYDSFVLVKDRNTGKVIFNRYFTNTWNKDPEVEVSAQCLRGIDTWVEDGKLHFACYFRSQDAWGGFSENYGGIQLVKEYMADKIGSEDGPLIAISKDLHVYRDCIPYAFALINKNPDDFDVVPEEVRRLENE